MVQALVCRCSTPTTHLLSFFDIYKIHFRGFHFFDQFSAYDRYSYFIANLYINSDILLFDIVADNQGLLVEFLWIKLRVGWNQIKQVKPAFPFAWLVVKQKASMIVLTNALTPFHRIFGLLYGFTLLPSFVIHPTINDFDLLIAKINSHVKRKQK
jgi:hypothetical protein